MSSAVEWAAKYTLTGPDGTIAVFNDSADPNFVGMLNAESSGLDSPEVRESAQDATEGDGGIHGDFFYGRRPVILQGTILATSKEDRNAKVAKLKRASNAMRGDATLKWKPAGAAEELELKLRRQQPLRITEGFVKKFMLPMVSASAYIEGATANSKTGAIAGSEFIGEPGTAPALIAATNAGAADAYPTITIEKDPEGPENTLTSPITMKNKTTGETIKIESGTSGADKLVVDFKSRTILLNGASIYSKLSFADSTWWTLQPGANEIEVTAVRTKSTYAKVTVTWRNTYL